MSLRTPIARQTLTIAVITVIAYGLLLPFIGFYWDDWPFAWIAKFLGPAEFIPAFMPFRPFLGPIFYLTTSVIPLHPLAWQIFALVIRFLIGVAAWWTFTQIFPTRKPALSGAEGTLAYLAALLMLVFPGYSQHWVALTHINQELIPFIFYLLSFGFTFKALRAQKITDTITALLLHICGVFPTEYFFGIEGIRFLLLFFFFQRDFNKTFKAWLPHLLIWILDAAWLYYYYNFGPYASYAVTAESPNAIYYLTQALDALWKSGFYIWIQILPLTFSSLPAPASLLALGLIALSFIFLIRILSRSAPDEASDKNFALSLILTGVVGILLGRLPSLAANLPLTLQSSFDRFMISIMPGATLFLLGVIELFIKSRRARVFVFSALIALGIGQQFFNANIFRRDWQKQGEIYWQMAWRMPALKADTLLLAYQMPIDYETDLSFTAPINWMYAPEYARSDLPYMLLYTEKRLGGSTLPSLDENIAIFYPYRTVNFNGSTSGAIVIHMPQNGCLRVLDPATSLPDFYSDLPEELIEAIPLSDTSRIMPKPEPSAAPVFFPEPEHGWCYHLAKAELAIQTGDFETASALADEALRLGLTPEEPREWLVFVRAYATTNQFDKAAEVSEKILESGKTLKAVCAAWEQIQSQSPGGGAAGFESARLRLGCNP
ncbi:MAG: hypothetical protein DYG85_14280 [Chloroflexi bacterium CFX1]|nr:hypothetical protein [Chloroflexi bacterium CFX1]MCQ3954617.1 hypothetical protein [Chloroflexota bacterium]MDL1918611.1 hypothetical protein [Chloroflexi bacterium CFX5]NUQ60709.1 hypothetical protein [Anaerolineales bacterium]